MTHALTQPYLDDGVPDRIEKVLVHLSCQGVVHEHVGSLAVWAESPQAAHRKQVPLVLGGEEVLRFGGRRSDDGLPKARDALRVIRRKNMRAGKKKSKKDGHHACIGVRHVDVDL